MLVSFNVKKAFMFGITQFTYCVFMCVYYAVDKPRAALVKGKCSDAEISSDLRVEIPNRYPKLMTVNLDPLYFL